MIKHYETVRKCWEKKYSESLAPYSLSGGLREQGPGGGVIQNMNDQNSLNMKEFKSSPLADLRIPCAAAIFLIVLFMLFKKLLNATGI